MGTKKAKSIAETTGLVVTNIKQRQDEYIMVTAKELLMANNTTSTLEIGSQLLIIMGSGMFGYLLNVQPQATKSYILQVIFTLLIFAIGFYFKWKKTTTIEEILKMYGVMK